MGHDEAAAPIASASLWSVQRVHSGADPVVPPRHEWLAEEVPVALEFNGIAHAVMLASPQDLEDFALGFSLAEGLIDSAADLLEVEPVWQGEAVVLQLRITARCEVRLKERRRSLAGRTGCGLCGSESLEHVCRPLPPVAVPSVPPLSAAAAVARAMHELAQAQTLQQRTGGVHAAAWCHWDGSVQWLREDVGRHNALDKTLGALARSGQSAAQGFVAVTSRASFEMVHKTAQAGVGMLAAVSAPTAMAVRLAQRSGVVLVGFARDDRMSVYTQPQSL